MLAMEYVEESSTKAAKGWSEGVGVYVVVHIMSAWKLDDGVSSESEADGRIEAGAQGVRASDAAHESDDNSDCSADASALAGSMLTFNHQDHTDEDESAKYLVDYNIEVHSILSTVLGCVVGARWIVSGVLWGENGHHSVRLVVAAEESQTYAQESAKDLRDNNHDHEQEVLAVVS